MNRPIRMKIISRRYETEVSLFSEEEEITLEDLKHLWQGEPEEMEIRTEGTRSSDGERQIFSYDETEATGMEGSATAISFLRSQPGVITMLREGSVSTALVFEEGKRHRCVYQTPYMPFEVCVYTMKVANRLESEGFLELDYMIEIQGARAERTKFRMDVYPG